MPHATAARSRHKSPKSNQTRRRAFDSAFKALSAEVSPVCASTGPRYNGRQMLALDTIHHGDSVKLLNDAPEGWADLVFADPPFNIGYLYHGYDDKKDVDEYVDWSTNWMKAVYRALKPGGSFYLAIGDEFAADLCVAARRSIGFNLRNWIIWHYTFGQQTRKMFAKSHTHILYFTKHKPDAGLTNVTFNADEVRVKSARQLIYNDPRANTKGKLPDDTWFLRPQEATLFEPTYREMVKTLPADPIDFFDPRSDTWNVSRVCGTFKEREGWHGCQMPIAILDRIIKASSNPGDVVLDPFNGSGTTAVAAHLLGRRYVGIDQSADYVRFANSRLEHAREEAEKTPANVAPKIFDAKRASKKQSTTDAFGRPRVARRKRSA